MNRLESMATGLPSDAAMRPRAGAIWLVRNEENNGYALKGWLSVTRPPGQGEPEVGLQVEGGGSHILPANQPSVDGSTTRCYFIWPRPHCLASVGVLRIRAFNLDTGEELDGSPVELPNEFEATPGELVQTAPLTVWPSGLTGNVGAAMPVQLANGLYVAVGEPARSVQFEMVDRFTERGQPKRGVRVTTPVMPQHLTVHLAPPNLPPAGVAQEINILAWLPKAITPAQQVQADVWLTRRSGNLFTQLRRIRRVRIFRQPTRVTAELRLSEEEAAASSELWLSIIARECRGLTVLLPELGPAAFARETRMEDARLEASFGALEELVRLHGATDRVLPSVTSTAPAVPASSVRHPFTEVIVPIYNGAAVVMECLRSLRAAATPDMRVLIVDDGSRAFTAEALAAEFGGDPRFRLHRRDHNRSYTKSINEGVMLTSAPWVVVLNSDTVVPAGWLHRLHAGAHAQRGTGLAGPLSNAATWQSIPTTKRPDGSWSTNDMIEARHLPHVQALLDREAERAYPEFPILNGFCTLISREVFARIGLYDEDAFPMGYGEETDLCLRARRAGFRLTVVDDCFVFHHKSVSFGAANRSQLTRAGGVELANKHLGVNIGALEQKMQTCLPLQRLRTRMAQLLAELD